MKKISLTILSIFTVISMTACSGDSTPPTDTPPTSVAESSVPESTDGNEASENTANENISENNQVQNNNGQGGNILIAYFGVPEADGVDAVARASRVVVNGEVIGNTQFLAQAIQRETGGDLFVIETVQPYPTRPELMDLASNEKSQNARPELSTQINNLNDYDVIFIGYPNWNADLPMPLYTFLEQYDLGGKTIVPFCPHGGSGFSNTIKTIADLQPNATLITDGFTVSRENVPSSENDVISWVQSLNLGN